MAKTKRSRDAARDVANQRRLRELADAAMVLADGIMEGRIHRAGQTALRIEVLRLMKTAIKMHGEQYPRRHFRQPSAPHNIARGLRISRLRGWSGRIGLIVRWEGIEHHYECVFCGESIATFPNQGVGAIPAALVKRFESHGWECGMRYLMEVGNS